MTVPSEREIEDAWDKFLAVTRIDPCTPFTRSALEWGFLAGERAALEAQHTRDEEAAHFVVPVQAMKTFLKSATLEANREVTRFLHSDGVKFVPARAWVSRSDKGATRDE